MWGCKQGVQLDGTPEEALRLLGIRWDVLRHMPQATLAGFPCAKALRRLAKGAANLGISNGWQDSSDDSHPDLVLHRKHIFECAIITLSPNVVPRLRIDKLGGDTNTAATAAHAAFQNVPDTQLTSYLLRSDLAPLVEKAGVACDNKERGTTCQLGDDVVGYTVRKILLIWVAAHVVECEHCDRWPILPGKWCGKQSRIGFRCPCVIRRYTQPITTTGHRDNPPLTEHLP